LSEEPESRVRIAFLIGSLEIGGAERQLVRLVNSLDPTRYEPLVICWHGRPVLAAELNPNVQFQHLQLGRVGARSSAVFKPVRAAALLWRLTRRLNAFRPRVLHAWLPAAYIAAAYAGRLAGVPVVMGARRGLVSYRTYPRLIWPFAELANRLLRVQVCNSEAVRRWALEQERLDPDRAVVIPNGVDLVTPSEPVPGRPPRAAMLANFHRYKGHALLVEALRRCSGLPAGFQVVLYGDGKERPRVEELARDAGVLDHLVFAGLQKDAGSRLDEFDFTLLCSTEEGFPNAVLESMAAGVPVVATAVGGVTELLRDQVDGLLVPSGDAGALAAAIDWMLAHPEERRRQGMAARERVAREFTFAAMVSAHEDIYDRLLGRRRGAAAMAES